MKRFAFAPLFFCIAINASLAQGFFDRADAFLHKYVKNGTVTYADVKTNIDQIDGLYKDIGNMNISSFGREEQKAFYIDAYNLIVIYWVAKHYPLKSPLDNSGFFDKVKHKVAGENLTLNALEIKKLRAAYKDPRVHFVLDCGAKSCPPLASFAYTADKLEQQLDTRTTKSLNDSNWLKVNDKDKTVALSKIFRWYNEDFVVGGQSVIQWINQYRSQKIPESYTVTYYEYDWSLNDSQG